MNKSIRSRLKTIFFGPQVIRCLGPFLPDPKKGLCFASVTILFVCMHIVCTFPIHYYYYVRKYKTGTYSCTIFSTEPSAVFGFYLNP